jgi:hypothetical protein
MTDTPPYPPFVFDEMGGAERDVRCASVERHEKFVTREQAAKTFIR